HYENYDPFSTRVQSALSNRKSLRDSERQAYLYTERHNKHNAPSVHPTVPTGISLWISSRQAQVHQEP
ncbi:hypothetical protein AAVH_30516, partial [Aphelenchoides avenae]